MGAVKERCKPQIEQYELCLKANASASDTCVPLLERLWECSEQVLLEPPAGQPASDAHVHGPDCGCAPVEPAKSKAGH